MGSGDAEQSLREAMALGADDGILLSDRILAGSDAWATGNALSCALAKLGGPELILTGTRSSDAGSSQIAARISYALDLPLVSNAAQLSVQDGSLLAKQYTASKVTTVETPLPAVAAVAPEHTEVRTLTAAGIVDAYHLKTVSVWSAADVGVDPDRVGLSHSLSNVVGTWVPETHGNCELLPGTPADAAAALVARLTDRHILAEGRN